MPLPLEFIVDGPPVSQQTRNKILLQSWINIVHNAAALRWNNEPPLAGEVTVTITYLFDTIDGVSLDVDNIPKPILDALKGLVYVDDTQVTDLLCRKRELQGTLRIHNVSPLLLQSITSSQSILHITVAESLDREVEL